MFTSIRLFASFHFRVLASVFAGLVVLAGKGVCGEPPFLVGADVSALATMEEHGAKYRGAEKKADALDLLRAEGFNCFRLRLFVEPNGKEIVTNSLEYTLALAKRVKASGATFMLDIHYSDTWADPAKQFKPAAWAKYTYDELKTQVRVYTRDVLRRFVAEGVKPDYVQLGNEITNGMLWPDGHVEFSNADNHAAWRRLGGLLCAAHEGLAEAFPNGGRPVSVLHIESPNQQDRALWFCREAVAAEVPFDWIGFSYYPDWHGSVAQLSAAMTLLAKEIKKPVIVVETAYPYFPDEHWGNRPNMNWPLTPAGQKAFLNEVTAAVRALPDGAGRGVMYWYPEAVLVSNMRIWVGGSCALFDRKGRLLPAASFARDAAR